jgi:cell division protein FtsI/penicillin-binding protein 2
LAPTKEFARPILGSVGPVTAEMIEKSEGRLVAGDLAGVSGLQARYDAQLGGTSGVEVLALPAEPTGEADQADQADQAEGAEDEAGPRVLFEVQPVAGTPLETTLDIGLQTRAEELLAGVKPASALVAVRPSTGEVLAAASGPGGKGYSNATVGQYAPGSTFKVVTSLALLRAGLTESSPVPCPPTTTVEGKSFKNYDDYPASGLGRITLSTAVANSCNTAFISQRDKLPQGALAESAAALGLGVDHDLGFPVFLGSVPSDMSGTDLAASTIGQGRVLASPYAMAAVAASISRGEVVVPRLLPGLEQSEAAPAKPLTPEEAAALQRLMGGVVTSGSGRFLSDVPGEPVLAKTGTAEFGTKAPLRTHGWMIAVHGDLAVAVFVEVAESGSATAGPILEGFLRAAG